MITDSTITFGTDVVPIGIGVGDFNGDGKPDLVVSSNDSANTIVVLFNALATTAAISGPASPTYGQSATYTATMSGRLDSNQRPPEPHSLGEGRSEPPNVTNAALLVVYEFYFSHSGFLRKISDLSTASPLFPAQASPQQGLKKIITRQTSCHCIRRPNRAPLSPASGRGKTAFAACRPAAGLAWLRALTRRLGSDFGKGR
jgi:hypothetical protein